MRRRRGPAHRTGHQPVERLAPAHRQGRAPSVAPPQAERPSLAPAPATTDSARSRCGTMIHSDAAVASKRSRASALLTRSAPSSESGPEASARAGRPRPARCISAPGEPRPMRSPDLDAGARRQCLRARARRRRRAGLRTPPTADAPVMMQGIGIGEDVRIDPGQRRFLGAAGRLAHDRDLEHRADDARPRASPRRSARKCRDLERKPGADGVAARQERRRPVARWRLEPTRPPCRGRRPTARAIIIPPTVRPVRTRSRERLSAAEHALGAEEPLERAAEQRGPGARARTRPPPPRRRGGPARGARERAVPATRPRRPPRCRRPRRRAPRATSGRRRSARPRSGYATGAAPPAARRVTRAGPE